VYSEPGVGTTFRISIPRTDVEQVADANPDASAAPVVGGAETVLLVEDEPAVRTFARRMLERHGYRVIAAGNPSEALGVAGEPDVTIDIVVTDMRMPGGTGPELVEALRRRRPELPALFVSGYTDLPYAAEGPQADPRYFLAKPFAGAALAAKVRAILDERAGAGPTR
jgi:DNA-binding NtrC family response regulator